VRIDRGKANISIPSGAIKSAEEFGYSAKELNRFQFLLVRLRDLQGCLNGIIFIMISIPSGAIKSPRVHR